MMTETEIIHILSNYHWMIKEVQRINYLLDQTEQSVTGQYGIEATLPKPQGVAKDAMTNEIIRRDKKTKRKIEMLKKIEFVQNRMHLIQDEREKVVLDCLLDGMSMHSISQHMGLSRRHIHRLRSNIAYKMSHMSQSLQRPSCS